MREHRGQKEKERVLESRKCLKVYVSATDDTKHPKPASQYMPVLTGFFSMEKHWECKHQATTQKNLGTAYVPIHNTSSTHIHAFNAQHEWMTGLCLCERKCVCSTRTVG